MLQFCNLVLLLRKHGALNLFYRVYCTRIAIFFLCFVQYIYQIFITKPSVCFAWEKLASHHSNHVETWRDSKSRTFSTPLVLSFQEIEVITYSKRRRESKLQTPFVFTPWVSVFFFFWLTYHILFSDQRPQSTPRGVLAEASSWLPSGGQDLGLL